MKLPPKRIVKQETQFKRSRLKMGIPADPIKAAIWAFEMGRGFSDLQFLAEEDGRRMLAFTTKATATVRAVIIVLEYEEKTNTVRFHDLTEA